MKKDRGEKNSETSANIAEEATNSALIRLEKVFFCLDPYFTGKKSTKEQKIIRRVYFNDNLILENNFLLT